MPGLSERVFTSYSYFQLNEIVYDEVTGQTHCDLLYQFLSVIEELYKPESDAPELDEDTDGEVVLLSSTSSIKIAGSLKSHRAIFEKNVTCVS